MLLNLLDRQFTIRLTRSRLAKLVPDDATRRTMYDKGVLKECAPPGSAPCPHGEHDGDEWVPIVRLGLDYEGSCQEHGRLFKLPADEVESVEFNPAAWAEAVRISNGLVGDIAFHEAGFASFGIIQTGTKKAALIVVAHSALGSPSQTMFPSSAGARHAIIVNLGERGIDSSPLNISANQFFDANMIAIRDDAKTRLFSRMADQYSSGVHALKYSDNKREPVPLSLEEYNKEIVLSNISRYDLFIDMVFKGTAWRNGRRVLFMASAKKTKKRKANTKQPISNTGLQQMASFIKRVGTALLSTEVKPYVTEGASDRDVKTPQVMLANMRRTLQLEDILLTGDNASGSVGGSRYCFKPTSRFKYTLLMPPEVS